METESNKTILANKLESLNVCSRCVLRFLGVKSYTSYSCQQEISKVLNGTLQSDGNSETSQTEEEAVSNSCSKRMRPSVCPLCLGVLQDCDKMIDKVTSEVKQSGFEFNAFTIQLSLPVAIDLREELVLLYIQDQLVDVTVALNREDIPSVKDVWKWVVGSGIGSELNIEFSPDSEFQIVVSVLYTDLIEECHPLIKACPAAFPNSRKRKATIEIICNRSAVTRAMETLTSKLKNLYTLPPVCPNNACTYDIICAHSPIYFAGRYNKYSRELSQTPWVVDGKRKMESSVQEYITDVVQKWVKSDSITFSASGREDVDVKMLGNGRPFVLECLNPHREQFTSQDMKDMQNEINTNTKEISVNLLQVTSKTEIKHLKEGEEQKRKTYSALCIVKKVLTSSDVETLEGVCDLTLKQKTPIRVLHRRPLATRCRIIHKICAEILSPDTIKIRLETQAGTYVKEFVHGDFGRTLPNLGSILGTEADILELDVESIHLDWPPIPSG